jgi:dihydroxy-acid dehydratase
VSPFEAVGKMAAGTISQEDFDGIEKHACPTNGACGGMYTANTMSSSFEALGMSLLGSSSMANPDRRRQTVWPIRAVCWSRRSRRT